jgi:hypothetical protein
MGIVFAFIFFAASFTHLALRLWVYDVDDDRSLPMQSGHLIDDGLHAVVVAVVMIIMALPEGLHLMVKLSL